MESWNALSFGQSADVTRFWPLLLLTLALVAVGVIVSWRKNGQQRLAAIFLLVATFGPLALILLASVLTPLYHVRYLFTYSPPFSILLALGMTTLARWRRPAGQWLAAGAALALLAGCALSLRAFWTDPVYAADDLRSATRELAQRWRPGDAILANAGYTYPALLTYWPGPVAWHGRLTDYTQESLQKQIPHAVRSSCRPATSTATRILAGATRAPISMPYPGADAGQAGASCRTELPPSVALSASTTRSTIPKARSAMSLPAAWTLFDDRVYRGEANLRVQGWQGMRQPLSSYLPPTRDVPSTAGWSWPCADAVPATGRGRRLYRRPRRPLALQPDQPGQPVALSLRLVDDQGEVWAAADEPLGGNALDLTSPSRSDQPLRLAFPQAPRPAATTSTWSSTIRQTGQPLAGHDGRWRPALRLCSAQVDGRAARQPIGHAAPPWPTSARCGWWRPAHLPRPSAQATRSRCRCSGRPRPTISPSRWSSSCSCWTRMARSSPAWRRNRWLAGIQPRRGRPASWCGTGTLWSCRPARRQARISSS